MGRPQTWDQDEVLKAAMAVFRSKGFSQTTMRDIGQVTGLHPGSLYKAYGSKDDLFVAALRAYNDRVVATRIATHLTGDDDPLAGIRSFFRLTFAAQLRRDPGCLVTNTAIEGFQLESKTRIAVSAGLDAIEHGLTAAVQRARARGQLGTTAAAHALGAQLLALYQGVLVLVRSGAPASKLAAITEDGLRSILGSPTRKAGRS